MACMYYICHISLRTLYIWAQFHTEFAPRFTLIMIIILHRWICLIIISLDILSAMRSRQAAHDVIGLNTKETIIANVCLYVHNLQVYLCWPCLPVQYARFVCLYASLRFKWLTTSIDSLDIINIVICSIRHPTSGEDVCVLRLPARDLSWPQIRADLCGSGARGTTREVRAHRNQNTCMGWERRTQAHRHKQTLTQTQLVARQQTSKRKHAARDYVWVVTSDDRRRPWPHDGGPRSFNNVYNGSVWKTKKKKTTTTTGKNGKKKQKK